MHLTRHVANTSALTVMYATGSGAAEGITVGKVGTAAAVVQAQVAAGNINNVDVSTLNWSIAQG
jgi:hypothetical protein